MVSFPRLTGKMKKRDKNAAETEDNSISIRLVLDFSAERYDGGSGKANDEAAAENGKNIKEDLQKMREKMFLKKNK